MTQELQRDDSLPYREYIIRPGESLDFGIEWAQWLSNRWLPGVVFPTGAVIRPRRSNGFEQIATIGGMTANVVTPGVEPTWATAIGSSVVDGAVTWTCQAISTASLVSSIASSVWSVDAPLSVSAASLSGTRALILANDPNGTPDADYYLRNFITLASGVTKEGMFLLRSRLSTI